MTSQALFPAPCFALSHVTSRQHSSLLTCRKNWTKDYFEARNLQNVLEPLRWPSWIGRGTADGPSLIWTIDKISMNNAMYLERSWTRFLVCSFQSTLCLTLVITLTLASNCSYKIHSLQKKRGALKHQQTAQKGFISIITLVWPGNLY